MALLIAALTVVTFATAPPPPPLDPYEEFALLTELGAQIEADRLEAERRAQEEAALAAQREQEARDAAAAAAPTSSGVPWDAIARCESGYGGEPQWDLDAFPDRHPYSDARYYGGLQFNKSSWDWAGGTRYAYWPHHATREQQIEIAERLLSIHPAGLGAWPACTRMLGLR